MARRALLIGSVTGYQTRTFAAVARRLGYELTLATDQCKKLEDPWGEHAITVRFEHAEAFSRRLAVAGPFDAIVAVGDHPTLLAAMTAERLGMPYHSPASVAACRNKYQSRKLFRAAGLPAPSYFRIRLGDAQWPRRQYPCVLKPLGLSGSRGVIRADDDASFAAAFHRIARLLESLEIRRLREEQNRFIQVEEFIEGREYALEGLLTNGRLRILALFDKPDPLDGPFFEETIYTTPSRAPAAVQEEIAATTGRALAALGLSHGPVHAEMRVNGRGVWMLEVAARPIGGLCAQTLRFAGGTSLEEVILRHATGENVEGLALESPASGVMMIPIPRGGVFEGTGGIEDAKAVPGIEDAIITAKPGQALVPLPEGSSYLGFLFARGELPAAVEDSLRVAHSKLRFRIAAGLPVLGS
jgi:hypothetical protein